MEIVWVVISISLINVYAFMMIPCYFHYYKSVIQAKVWNGDTPSIVDLLFKIVLAILLFVCLFPYEFEDLFSQF